MSSGNITASYLSVTNNGTGATKKAGLEITGAAIVNLGTAITTPTPKLTFTGNTGDGVFINATAAGSKVALQNATLSNNTNDGIQVDLNGGTAANAATAALDTDTLSSNGNNGIEILQAPAAVSATVMTMNNVTVSSNGTPLVGSGVFLNGANGPVVTILQNSFVFSNKGTGVTISNTGTGAMTEAIVNNDIHENAASGVLFNGRTNLTGFSANKVHGNVGDQITISAQMAASAPSLTYNFDNASIDPCDVNRNQVWCYGNGTVGIKSTINNIVVNAAHMSWKVSNPSNNNDFIQGGGTGSVTFAPTCAAIGTTCP